MVESNENDKEKRITESLNVGGVFLQSHIVNILTKDKWAIIEEYPVNVAPFYKDPEFLNYASNEYRGTGRETEEIRNALFNSQILTEQLDSAVDIVATKRFSQFMVTMCIEVKKRSPKFTSWVFASPKPTLALMRNFAISMDKTGVPLLIIPKHPPIGNELCVKLVNEYPLPCEDEEIHFYEHARALLKKQEIAKDFYDTDSSDVDKACRQACVGTYGAILDNLMDFLRSKQYPPNQGVVFLPIVVSTNLIACHYDPTKIDDKTGRIDMENAVTYKPVDLLLYDCTPPKSVRFPISKTVGSQNPYMIRRVSRWRVIIATPKGLNKFLNIISTNY